MSGIIDPQAWLIMVWALPLPENTPKGISSQNPDSEKESRRELLQSSSSEKESRRELLQSSSSEKESRRELLQSSSSEKESRRELLQSSSSKRRIPKGVATELKL